MKVPSERLLRFVQWNDLHVVASYRDANRKYYPGGNARAAWVAQCANGQHGFDKPDFVASVGDLIDGETANYDDDFATLGELCISSAGVPVLPCAGNHENKQGALNESFDRCVGVHWHDYAYTHTGIAFIVVDTSACDNNFDAVSAARHAFLDRAFERFADWPVIVITHVPLVMMREPEVFKKSFGFPSYMIHDPGMLQRIEARSRQVIAVFSGHIHLTGVVRSGGIHHIMPGGIASYPCDFASYNVFADRIDVQMHQVPAQLIGDPAATDIHGKNRFPIDYTDSVHPTHKSYMMGNTDERNFTIPLSGDRQPRADAERLLRIWHEPTPNQWVEASLPW